MGQYPCRTLEGSQLRRIYSKEMISERHRHRYEFNNEFRERYEQAGMIFSGRSPSGELVEALELRDHPFFVGVQYHPEYKSRFEVPHPLFMGFVNACRNTAPLRARPVATEETTQPIELGQGG